MSPDFAALLAFAPPVLGKAAADTPDDTPPPPPADKAKKKPAAEPTLIDLLRLDSTLAANAASRDKLAAVEKVAHYKQVCSKCGDVIVQCRCPGPVTDLSYGVCRKCGGEKEAADGSERGPVTVCIDLDGTLARKQVPFDPKTIGRPRRKFVRLARLLKEKGCRVVVWTVRGDGRLVKRWLRRHRVPYDFVNENPDQPPGSSGKLYADVYVDDKAVNAEDAAAAIRETLERVAPLLADRDD